MPIIALALSGVAAKAQYDKIQSAKYDESINLEGKASITLMTLEQDMAVLQFPVATLTFFQGDYHSVVPFLEKRVDEVIQANPWLGGWLIRDINDACNVKIFHDAAGVDRCDGKHFEVFEDFAAIPLTQEMKEMREYEQMLHERGVTVPFNHELIGQNRPFWKVSIVPCKDRAEEQFALVVSMSHALGDGHTYYQLFNMLDKDAPVVALDPVRVSDYNDKLVAMIGTKEAEYFSKAVTNPLVDLTGSTDERIVFRKFFLDEDWVLERKSQEEVDESGSVSINSILTSWFFNINEASIGLMTVNLRHRMENCTLDDTKAGNYVHPIVYTPVDYRTPGLIQESLKYAKRCGPNTPKDLPGLGWKMTCSLTNEWSGFHQKELNLHEDVSTTLHQPFWHLQLLQDLPNRLSYLHLFTARPSGLDGRERQLGVTVLCRESVWAKIQKSGIFKETM